MLLLQCPPAEEMSCVMLLGHLYAVSDSCWHACMPLPFLSWQHLTASQGWQAWLGFGSDRGPLIALSGRWCRHEVCSLLSRGAHPSQCRCTFSMYGCGASPGGSPMTTSLAVPFIMMLVTRWASAP